MRRLATILAVALASACAHGDPAGPSLLAVTDGQGVAPVVVGADFSRWRFDAYSPISAELRRDTLELRISHGGGCQQHTFALLTAAEFMESDPVQVRVALAHDAKGDMCRALVHRTLQFDLAPLRERWQASYRQTSGTIVLRIDGWDRPVVYSF